MNQLRGRITATRAVKRLELQEGDEVEAPVKANDASDASAHPARIHPLEPAGTDQRMKSPAYFLFSRDIGNRMNRSAVLKSGFQAGSPPT